MAAMSGNSRAIAFMVAAMATYQSTDALMKAVGEHMPIGQSLFLRGWLVLAALAATAWWRGELARWRPRGDRRVMARALLETLGSLCYLGALPHVPLATGSAATMSVPLLALPFAALILRERFGWRLTLAVVAGFLGAALVIKPDPRDLDPWAVVLVLGAAGFAVRDVITRMIARDLPTTLVAAITITVVTLTSLPVGLAQGWVVPRGFDIAALVLSGLLVAAATQFMILATRGAAISVVSGFRYSGILWAVLIGYVAWGELPDRWGWLGLALVVLAGLYALHRARVER
jgi:drug/metabolite transporter (DMT)-like permease